MSHQLVRFANEDINIYSLLDEQGQVWLLANTFAEILGYNRPNNVIFRLVSKNNQRNYADFKSLGHGATSDVIDATCPNGGHTIQKLSKFINRAGKSTISTNNLQ